MHRMDVLNASALSQEEPLPTPRLVAFYARQSHAKQKEQSVELYTPCKYIPKHAKLFGSLTQSLWPDRRLYITSKGYIGLGPLSTQVGDEVWVICDAKIPLVLHPQPENSKQCRLVGETYLHGFMNGEALKSGLLDHLRWVDLI